MTFVSLEFLILFVFTAIGIIIFKEKKQRQIVLLVASYIFYAYWDIRFLGLLIFQTYISYYLAKRIAVATDSKSKKRYCIWGVTISLCILGFFKYFNFFIETFKIVNLREKNDMLHIILPIGISFYTFQAMSYLIDVYREKITARKDFLTVSLYISFFPQLVAGPIVRAADFLPQLDENHEIKLKNVETALQIFIFGLFKKVVIADRLSVCADAVFATPMAYDAPSIICAVIAYSMQIYCDFSGYSDMAIGVAKFFDYDLCENFNMPYISKNLTEFWKRWHISLSTWLRDYLYIPLGGNRKGKLRTYINLILTMLLGGLWHGANWTFVIWGGLHGFALVVHKAWMNCKRKWHLRCDNKIGKGLLDILAMAGTYIFVCVCWVFFRAENLSQAIMILQRIFAWEKGIHYMYVFTIIFSLIVIISELYGKIKNNGNGKYVLLDLNKFLPKVMFCIILWLIFVFMYNGENAFVYFQF